MNVYACRLKGVAKQDISVVFCKTCHDLFWILDENSDPYQYEIIKLKTNNDMGMINLLYTKQYDAEIGDEFFDLDEDTQCDGGHFTSYLPDKFDEMKRYRLEKNGVNDYALIPMKKNEEPF